MVFTTVDTFNFNPYVVRKHVIYYVYIQFFCVREFPVVVVIFKTYKMLENNPYGVFPDPRGRMRIIFN